MNMTSFSSQVFSAKAARQWALLGILCSPVLMASSQAVELVGKPAPVSSAAAVSSVAAASKAAISASAASAASASAPAAPVAPQATITDEVDMPEMPPMPQPPANPDEEMRRAMEVFKHADAFEHPGGFAVNPDVVIPVVAISVLFGGPVVLIIVLAVLYYRAKDRRQKNINANIDKLLAAGRDIPLELLLNDEAPLIKLPSQTGGTAYARDNTILYKGIKNIGLGVGLLIFLTIFMGIKIGSVGFILIGLGISKLVIWKLSGTAAGEPVTAVAPKAQD